jgi:hypothetical protein
MCVVFIIMTLHAAQLVTTDGYALCAFFLSSMTRYWEGPGQLYLPRHIEQMLGDAWIIHGSRTGSGLRLISEIDSKQGRGSLVIEMHKKIAQNASK